MMKTLIYLLLAFTFALILTSILMAQPFLPSDPSQEVPIDGGLSLLAAAGGGYAIKKLRDRSKAEAESMDDIDS